LRNVLLPRESLRKYRPILSVELWDWDLGPTDANDDFSGRVCIDLSDARATAQQDPQWKTLFRAQEGDLGPLPQLLLSCKVSPASQRQIVMQKPESAPARIEIYVLGLRQLSSRGIVSPNKPFVEVTVGDIGTTPIETKAARTASSRKPSSTNPNLVERLVIECHLVVDTRYLPNMNLLVKDSRFGGRHDTILGSASIPLTFGKGALDSVLDAAEEGNMPLDLNDVATGGGMIAIRSCAVDSWLKASARYIEISEDQCSFRLVPLSGPDEFLLVTSEGKYLCMQADGQEALFEEDSPEPGQGSSAMRVTIARAVGSEDRQCLFTILSVSKGTSLEVQRNAPPVKRTPTARMFGPKGGLQASTSASSTPAICRTTALAAEGDQTADQEGAALLPQSDGGAPVSNAGVFEISLWTPQRPVVSEPVLQEESKTEEDCPVDSPSDSDSEQDDSGCALCCARKQSSSPQGLPKTRPPGKRRRSSSAKGSLTKGYAQLTDKTGAGAGKLVRAMSLNLSNVVAGQAPGTDGQRFKKGMVVEYSTGPEAEWRQAVVQRVVSRKLWRCDIQDSASGKSVRAGAADAQSRLRQRRLPVGQAVEVNIGGKWFLGKISDCRTTPEDPTAFGESCSDYVYDVKLTRAALKKQVWPADPENVRYSQMLAVTYVHDAHDEYMCHREELDTDVETHLGNAPFTTIPVWSGQGKARRITGYFKGLIRVHFHGQEVQPLPFDVGRLFTPQK
jgi:hypothetical protein